MKRGPSRPRWNRRAIRWVRIFFIGRSDGDALEIAQAECHAEGWPWLQPQVESCELHWVVNTQPDAEGRSARIIVNKFTGEIVCKSFIRRIAAEATTGVNKPSRQ
jgi:hypothetical protein